jgi:hypothetical protein
VPSSFVRDLRSPPESTLRHRSRSRRPLSVREPVPISPNAAWHAVRLREFASVERLQVATGCVLRCELLRSAGRRNTKRRSTHEANYPRPLWPRGLSSQRGKQAQVNRNAERPESWPKAELSRSQPRQLALHLRLSGTLASQAAGPVVTFSKSLVVKSTIRVRIAFVKYLPNDHLSAFDSGT